MDMSRRSSPTITPGAELGDMTSRDLRQLDRSVIDDGDALLAFAVEKRRSARVAAAGVLASH
jgi:hypothetical protein